MGKDKKEKISKKHKKSRKPSTSDSSASSDEWIEKETSEDSVPSRPVETKSAPVEREDDWGSVFSGMSTVDIRKAKEAEKAKEKVSMEVKPGQSIRELNPYWKDGGSGLPPERDVGKNLVSSFRKPNEDDRGYSGGRFSRTDDDGRSSESKSRRTGEGGHQNDHQSSRSNRYEETDMASNRSGRFKRPNDRDGYGKNHQSSRNGQFRRPDDDGYRRNHQASRNDQFRRPGNEERSSKSKFRRPDDDEYCKDHQSLRSGQFRPDYDGERFKKPDDDRASSSRSTDKGEESSKSRRGWRKSDSSVNASTSAPILPKRDSCSPVRVEIVRKSPSPPSQSKILTSDEINELNAKIFRAEISGKTDLVAKLKKELENSRREETEKTVILTQTDSKGYTRPVKREERAQGSKNKKKVQTHENSKRVRYFADDDDYSLQDMYEKEKYSSARDQEEDFMNLMGKEMARKDGSLALDDPFEETASIDNRNKKEKQQWDRAVRDQAKKEKIYDECKWCLGAKRMNEKLVIKTKQKVYLSCPPFQSLTEGHCLIIPHSHISCSLQADEDVWDEVMELRKELVRKLERNDEDCVFFETASYLHKHPHMILHCVPLPREIGDMAPIYFKKALLDCESEWTDNKKVVDLAGRGVRKAVPKGLPYFFVDFGDQAGYAHVIEDLKLFPNNFAQEIIGGMLDLNHELWRKQRNVSDKELEKNVKYLKQLMEETNNCD